MKTLLQLAEEQDFKTGVEFYQYIVDSITIHGQPEEALKHYLSMDLFSKNAFLHNWLSYYAPYEAQRKFHLVLIKHLEGEIK